MGCMAHSHVAVHNNGQSTAVTNSRRGRLAPKAAAILSDTSCLYIAQYQVVLAKS
jgi:hypothetical protein